MSKHTNQTSETRYRPTLLDEETSARVLAEYLSIKNIQEKEIQAIEEVLGIPPAFEIAARFRLAFERAQLVMNAPASNAAGQHTT